MHGASTTFLPPSIHFWKHAFPHVRLIFPPRWSDRRLLHPSITHTPGFTRSAPGTVNTLSSVLPLLPLPGTVLVAEAVEPAGVVSLLALVLPWPELPAPAALALGGCPR